MLRDSPPTSPLPRGERAKSRQNSEDGIPMTEPSREARADALLSTGQGERTRRLKIFLGAAPGVGKTYAMLSAARELKQQGVDVVVGLAETHGRAETAALLDGVEVLSRRPV